MSSSLSQRRVTNDIILIPHHPVCRLAWATLGRDVEYALKIGDLSHFITNNVFPEDCQMKNHQHPFMGSPTRKWSEAHEQLSEGQHDDTSAVLQHHEEVY